MFDSLHIIIQSEINSKFVENVNEAPVTENEAIDRLFQLLRKPNFQNYNRD
jgi:hypothetical protein